MNEKQIRVIDAIEALRSNAPKTMARLGQLVAAHDSAVALSEARAFRMESTKSATRRTGVEPRAEDVRRVDELVASLEALNEPQPVGPRPLISDATLAKIVRLLTRSDLAAWETRCWDLVEMVAADRLAPALDYVRGASDDPALIAALEDANEEAARNADSDNDPGTAHDPRFS